MKYLTTVTFLTSVAGLVASAQPHKHQHLHAQKRNPSPVVDVVEVAGPVVLVYELNGHLITAAEVQEGIKNGSLIWASGAQPSYASSSTVLSTSQAVVQHVHSHSSSSYSHSSSKSLSSSSSTFSSTISLSSVTPTSSTTSLRTSTPATTAAVTTSSSSTTTHSTSTTSAQASYTASTSTSGIFTDFPDGELDCSAFPSAYGAVDVDYLELGGWIGVQCPGSSAGGFSNILTVNTNTCSDKSCCTEGCYCSFACPPGYQKSQWPAMQGATGQSVGGLLCENGKLRLTNPSLSKTICIPGTTAVNVMVKNTMDTGAVMCRTDYPGTESETIPLNTQAGETYNLTCPDASTYYKWKGMSTSAQYYVNPAGVNVSDACNWGTEANDWGNFAPLNLGVGYSDGSAWLSIFQNSPTTNAKLDFTVEIVGDNGGFANMGGRCKYSNGQYCSGDNYESCSSTTGCTVAVSSGTATYVLSSP